MSMPGEACREKYWGEKTDQEKILILGEVVDMLAKRIEEMEHTLVDALQHSHGPDGEMLIPLRRERFETPYWMKNPLRREGK